MLWAASFGLLLTLCYAQLPSCTSQCLNFNTSSQLVTPVCFVNSSLVQSTVLKPFNVTRCLWNCGLGVLYPGACGCPSFCFSFAGRGFCDANHSTCQCAPGWGGRDCSRPTTQSVCRGQGVIQKDGFGKPFCLCQAGFSGSECEKINPTMSNLPWGDLVLREDDDGPVFYGGDPGDNHPLFCKNQTVVLSINMNDSVWQKILLPQNYEWPYQKKVANVTMMASARQNDAVSIAGCDVKLGGHYTKRLAKKGWLLKSPNNSPFFNGLPLINKLKLKTGATDPSYINSLLGTDIFRSCRVPVARATTAQLFINDFSQGFNILYESIDESFLVSRFGSSNGNFYAGDGGTFAYLGDTEAPYLSKYSQESGNGNWSDFLYFVKALNNSGLTDSELETFFNVDGFVRHLAIEALFSFGDGFTCRGSNFYLYNNNTLSQPYFVLVPHDFDDSMGTKSGLNVTQWATVNLLQWGHKGICNDQDAYLTLRVLGFPRFQQLYVHYIRTLMKNLTVERLMTRVLDYFDGFHSKFLWQDAWYPLDSGGLDNNFFPSIKNHFELYFTTRYATALKQLLKVK